MNHPEGVDGFYYASRFTGRLCTVLFGYERISSFLKNRTVGVLTDLEESGQFLEENEIALV